MLEIAAGLISMISLPSSRDIIISSVRVYVVVEGEWYPDNSWDYDPMLSMENAEIGGTLIALTISGLKLLIDKVFSELDGIAENTAAAAMAFNMAFLVNE